MDVGLGWLGVIAGLLGFVATFLMAGASAESLSPVSDRRKVSDPLIAALVLTVLFGGVSLFKQDPFSAGQTLGLGFINGGFAGVLGILISSRLGSIEGSQRTRQLSVNSILFFSLFCVSITYTIFHADPWDAVIGFAIGAAMTGILFCCGGSGGASAKYMEMWTIFGITLAAGVAIAAVHFNQPGNRVWWPVPILLATTVCIASYIVPEFLSMMKRKSFGAAAAVSSAVVIGLCAAYCGGIKLPWELLETVLTGICVGAVGIWLSAGLKSRDVGTAGIFMLLLVAFVVLTFKIWSGLGIAVGLIAIWTLAIPALRDDSDENTVPDAARSILNIGLMLLLFRIFIQEYRWDFPYVDLQMHYTFVSAVIGAVLVFILASWFERAEDRSLWAVVPVALAFTVVPAAFYMVWELKAVLGVMFGICAGVVLLPVAGTYAGLKRPLDPTPAVPVLIGAELIAIRFTGILLGFDLTRPMKMYSIAAIAVLCVIVFSMARRAGRRS